MIALALSIACLALNAFFVAAEFALVKVHATQIEEHARKGERRGIAAKVILTKLDRFLSVTQFGITVASLGLGWIAEPALERLGDSASMAIRGTELGPIGHGVVGALGLATLTFLHLLIGELVPKFVALQYPRETLLNTALPLKLMNSVFRPVMWFLEKAQRGVLRLINIDPEVASEGALSEEELLGILAATARRGARGGDKARLVERVLRFANRPVRHVMIPRVDVITLPLMSSGEVALAAIRQHGFSRILLTEGTKDSVIGYMYAKDFFLEDEGRARMNLKGLERPCLYVPDSSDALTALRLMQRERVPMAVVVDEFGGTSGIITFEDLIEEVVGEIRDELDVEAEMIQPAVTDPLQVWSVDARATADELREAGVPIDTKWQGEPIGKVVIELLGRLPRMGDTVKLADDVVAEVADVVHRRIRRVLVRLQPG